MSLSHITKLGSTFAVPPNRKTAEMQLFDRPQYIVGNLWPIIRVRHMAVPGGSNIPDPPPNNWRWRPHSRLERMAVPGPAMSAEGME